MSEEKTAGVIGVGKWGVNHARTYAQLGYRVIVFDADCERARDYASKNGFAAAGSLDELLAQSDFVSIAVPTTMHYEIAKRCIDAGVACLVEKPLASTAAQARELAALAEKRGVLLATGHLFRFNAAVRKIRELLANERIQYVTLRFIHSTNPPRTDSGVIFNFASHLFDVLDYCMAERPKTVYCSAKKFVSPQFEDAALATLDYGSFFASLEMSWLHPEKKRDAWFVCENAKYYCDFLAQEITAFDIEISREKIENKGSRRIALEKNEPLFEELKHFADCALNGKKACLNDARVGARLTEWCEKTLESAESGKIIRF